MIIEDIKCCKYCRFWKNLECRKNTPVFVNRVGKWPSTLPTDWCGSFDGNEEWEKIKDERTWKPWKPPLTKEEIEGLVRIYKDQLRTEEETAEMVRKYKETL